MDEKLTLRKEMINSYLIQRLHKPHTFKIGGIVIGDNPFSFGGGLKNGGLSNDAMKILRTIFTFDYMGSAEFEWGAVPEALRFIAEQSEKSNIVTGELNIINEYKVYYVSPKEYEEEVKTRIYKLMEDEYKNFHLKERCGLNKYFTSDNEWDKRNVGWLELDNGFAFFVDKEMFDNFKKILNLN